MPAKLKFPGKKNPKSKQQKAPLTKKKWKPESSEEDDLTPLPSDEEEDEEDEETIAMDVDEGDDEHGTGPSQRPRRKSRSITTTHPSLDAQDLFDTDQNVDIASQTYPPPTQGSTSAEPSGPSSRSPSPQPRARSNRARGKKKATVAVLTSDDEEQADIQMEVEFEDDGAKRDDADEDFVINDDAPRKKSAAAKRAEKTTGRRAKGRGGKAKGIDDGEIMIKDERKSEQTESVAGSKRRRESTATAGVSDPTAITGENEPTEGASTSTPATSTTLFSGPPNKLRKLPTIKKNKSLSSSTSSLLTPSASKDPFVVSRKAIAKPHQTTADVDLSSADIYNSLFKGSGGGSTPRAGVNSRLKEEERKKELGRMRDEARERRILALQNNTFDLTRAHERVSAFEEELRTRNSPALYPNHLGSSFKYYWQRAKTQMQDIAPQQGAIMGEGGLMNSRD